MRSSLGSEARGKGPRFPQLPTENVGRYGKPIALLPGAEMPYGRVAAGCFAPPASSD
jgi:hypothetical protein